MESAAGSSGSGANGECEGEDQDDSSSNSNDAVIAGVESLNLQEVAKEEDDVLSEFRQQWQRELVSTPSPQRQVTAPVQSENTVDAEPENDDEKAMQLFCRGVELERNGKLYEAIQFYKRAVQLLPDVEKRLYAAERRADTPEVQLDNEPQVTVNEVADSDEDDEDYDGDLVAKIQRILAKKESWCEPAQPQKEAHLSWLPSEVVRLILRWTVGRQLDAAAAERAGQTCRGLYLCARDVSMWRALCVRTWGIDCGTPKANGFSSWRDMYIDRPRLHLHGCYISKTSYLRHGENSFQDHFYKPWYLIDYYRYLRFFPDGVVLMWTTADEPAMCVSHLKHRVNKNTQGIMTGHYRLVGDKVVIVIKKQGADKKSAQTTNTRFRARRKDSVHEQQEQIFHIELQLRSLKSRRNCQLLWSGYSVCNKRGQWTGFELTPNKYPPFHFSVVRNYMAESDEPLT